MNSGGFWHHPGLHQALAKRPLINPSSNYRKAKEGRIPTFTKISIKHSINHDIPKSGFNVRVAQQASLYGSDSISDDHTHNHKKELQNHF